MRGPARAASAIAAAVVLAGLVSAVPPALACGDKLMVLGGGLPFERVHVGRRQSNVILFLNPESRLSATNAELRLDQTLARAGHKVRSVVSTAELTRALDEARADFVLMDWRDTRLLPGPLRHSVPIMPVTYGANAEERAAAQASHNCVVEASKGRARQLVRAIETILERDASSAGTCAGSGNAAGG
jgi:hypothetical protein